MDLEDFQTTYRSLFVSRIPLCLNFNLDLSTEKNREKHLLRFWKQSVPAIPPSSSSSSASSSSSSASSPEKTADCDSKKTVKKKRRSQSSQVLQQKRQRQQEK